MAGEAGVVTEALRRREQGLKSEGEQDNKEGNNENGKRMQKKLGVRRRRKKRICEGIKRL